MNPGWYEKGKHQIRYFLLRKLPTCREAVEIISQSLERPLSLRERIYLKLHLYVCVWCVWYLEHLKLIRRSARASATIPHEIDFAPAVALSPEARERIKQQINSSSN